MRKQPKGNEMAVKMTSRGRITHILSIRPLEGGKPIFTGNHKLKRGKNLLKTKRGAVVIYNP